MTLGERRRRTLPVLLLIAATLIGLAATAEMRARGRADAAFDAVADRAGLAVGSWMERHLLLQRSLAFGLEPEEFSQALDSTYMDFGVLLDDAGIIQAIHPARPDLDVGDELVGEFAHIDAVVDGADVGFWATDQGVTASGRILAVAIPAGRAGGVMSVAFDPGSTPIMDGLELTTANMDGLARVSVIEPSTGVVVAAVGDAPHDAVSRQVTSPTGLLVRIEAAPDAVAGLIGGTTLPALRVLALVLTLIAAAGWWRLPAIWKLRTDADLRADAAETIFLQSHTPTLVMDADYRITRVNPALLALTGHSLDQLLGTHALKVIVHPDDFFSIDPVKVVRADGAVAVFREQRFLRADGEVRYGRITGDPILGEDGELRGYVGQVIDLTDLRVANEALESSREELQYLGHRVAHDLLNPLSAMHGFAEMLSSGRLDEDRTERVLSQLRDSAAAAMQQVKNLLTRAERVGGEPLQPVDLAELHDWLQRIVAADLAQTGGSVDLDTELRQIAAPPTGIRTVLVNLVGNAIKYRRAAAPPRISIHVQERGDHSLITVSDNGIGVPADQLAAIFTNGMRLDPDHADGHGAGLAEVARLVNLAGGRCWATANSPNGLNVHIQLPSEAAGSSAEPDPVTQPGEKTAGRR